MRTLSFVLLTLTILSFGFGRDGAPQSLTTADLDGDGRADLLAGFVFNNGGYVSLFRGLGPGSEAYFAHAEILFYTRTPPRFLVVDDFDADGLVDVVWSHQDSTQLFWRRGLDGLRFGPVHEIALGGPLTALIGADLLGADRVIDLAAAVAGRSPTLLVFDSIHRDPLRIDLPSPAHALVAENVSGSYLIDLLIYGQDEVHLLEGRDARLDETPLKLGVKALGRLDDVPVLKRGTQTVIEPVRLRLNNDAVLDRITLDHTGAPDIVLSKMGSVFRVNTTDDLADGSCDVVHCSLRDAIYAANANPGLDRIEFAVGSGPITIAVATSLPSITDPVVIDGATQPGYVGRPIVELEGSLTAHGSIGLEITGGSSLIRGLVINRFKSFNIRLLNLGDNIIEANYLGTDVTGQTPLPVFQNLSIASGSGNLIGGPTPEAGNLISADTGSIQVAAVGNTLDGLTIQGNIIGLNAEGTSFITPNTIFGVYVIDVPNLQILDNLITIDQICISVGGPDSSGFIIQGNHIGVNAAGDDHFNVRATGVSVVGTDGGGLIGGTTPQARNVISGINVAVGLGAQLQTTDHVVVQGNYLGLDVTGARALGLWHSGVDGTYINDCVFGGSDPGSGNVIAGMASFGIRIRLGSAGNVIQGNVIGTDHLGLNGINPADTRAVGIGLELVQDTLIGGLESGAGNLLSGNRLGIGAASLSGTRVEGNLIGTDRSGTYAIPNVVGVNIGFYSADNTIGGTEPGAGNLISGNLENGIYVGGENTRRTSVIGNTIGTAIDQTTPLGNGNNGIAFWDTNIEGAAINNVVVFNAWSGIYVERSSRQVMLRNNSIFENGLLGIDLYFPDVTLNDIGDRDTLANFNLNFPVITSGETAAATTTISGTYNSKASSEYTLEFFHSPACDPSGYGEGKTPLGTITVTTDSVGDASFSATFPVGVDPDGVLTVTATDVDGNTSEFSQCADVQRVGPIACGVPAVVLFDQGLELDGSAVVPERSDVTRALGEPEADDSPGSFVSLGIGGELVLEFDIVNGPGDDLEVFETTYNTCEAYPEYLEVFAWTGTDWLSLGTSCHDSRFDLGPLASTRYLRLVDRSDFGNDGYDVDGVRCLNGGGGEIQAPPMMIVDNTDADFTAIGVWTVSDYVTGHHGVDYLHDGNQDKGAAQARFQANLSNGRYRISLRWTEGTNRATRVPVSIQTTAGVFWIYVDQTSDGGLWNELGVWHVEDSAVVTLHNLLTDGHVIADAVRFDPVEPGPDTPSEIAPPVIVDQREAALIGEWTTSTAVPGYYGDDYIHDADQQKGAKFAMFSPDLPQPGLYEVSILYSSGDERASNIPITVTSASGDYLAYLDQRSGGGVWTTLGQWRFSADGGDVVTIGTDFTDGFVIVDAVRFDYAADQTGQETPTAPPLPVVVDDRNCTFEGDWTPSTYTTGYYGEGYHHDAATGAEKSATFTPDLPESGAYEVYLRWTGGGNRTSNATVIIQSQEGETTQQVDQRINGGEWKYLGTYTFGQGTSGWLRLENTHADGHVIADAAQFVRVL